MGEEKQQGERRTGNGSAQGRCPVSGRSSIYGSKESQQMMKRSAQHSAQARRVQTGEEKRAVSGYEKRTKKEGMQSENAKAGVEKRRSGQTASGVPAERNIKKQLPAVPLWQNQREWAYGRSERKSPGAFPHQRTAVRQKRAESMRQKYRKQEAVKKQKAKYPHRARISAATNSLPAVSGDLAVSCLSCILQ